MSQASTAPSTSKHSNPRGTRNGWIWPWVLAAVASVFWIPSPVQADDDWWGIIHCHGSGTAGHESEVVIAEVDPSEGVFQCHGKEGAQGDPCSGSSGSLEWSVSCSPVPSGTKCLATVSCAGGGGGYCWVQGTSIDVFGGNNEGGPPGFVLCKNDGQVTGSVACPG